MDSSVVIVEGRRKRGLNGNGKNTIKIKLENKILNKEKIQ